MAGGGGEIQDAGRRDEEKWRRSVDELIPTCPPEHYDFLAMGLRVPPRVSEACRNDYGLSGSGWVLRDAGFHEQDVRR
jgi:hypothetical protein